LQPKRFWATIPLLTEDLTIPQIAQPHFSVEYFPDRMPMCATGANPALLAVTLWCRLKNSLPHLVKFLSAVSQYTDSQQGFAP